MLKNLKELLESESKNEKLFDIVIYGSILKGKDKANDVDIIAIFKEGTLRERLDCIQGIKARLGKATTQKIDIKQMLLTDFFSKEFMARTGIIIEGYSVFNKKDFSKTLGFKSYTLFWYVLKDLTHTEKVKFNYIMAGRYSEGIAKELGAERISKGVIKLPISNSLQFESILKKNNIRYSKKNIMEEA